MTTQPSPKDGLSEPSVLADKSPGVGFFKKLKIGPKLTVGFGILVVLTFLGAAVSYLGSNQATTKINRTLGVSFQILAKQLFLVNNSIESSDERIKTTQKSVPNTP